jgi:hypothetical protein
MRILVVVALAGAVLGGRVGGDFLDERPSFLLPLEAAAVHHLCVGVAEELEDPEGVAGPPVVLVAVEDDGGFRGDADAAHELFEAGAVEVVAAEGVVEVSGPVDLDGAGDVAGGVEEGVFVRFDDADGGVVEVLGDPFGGDQDFGMGVPACSDFGVGHGGAPFVMGEDCGDAAAASVARPVH